MGQHEVRRDPLESLIFFLGVIGLAFLARYCRNRRYSLPRAFATGVAYSIVFVLCVVAFAVLSPMHSPEGLGHDYLPIAIAFFALTSGAWCSYEAHRGILDEMEQ